MTDLTSFATKEENWMQLENPFNSEPLDIYIKVTSTDSEAYQKQVRKNRDRIFKKGMRNLTAEEQEHWDTELLVACTLDWKEVIDNGEEKRTLTVEGEELECNPQNVRKLYKNRKTQWIKEQVDEYIGKRANFKGE